MIKKILKGILLWITMIFILLFASGIDSIMNHGSDTFILWSAIGIFLVILCSLTISAEEFYTLSGAKLIDKITN